MPKLLLPDNAPPGQLDRQQLVAWLNALPLTGPLSRDRNTLVDALMALPEAEPEAEEPDFPQAVETTD